MGRPPMREIVLGVGVGAALQVVDLADAGLDQLIENEAGEIEMLAAAIGLGEAI